MSNDKLNLWLVEDDESQASLFSLLTEQVAPEMNLRVFSSAKSLLSTLESEKKIGNTVLLSDLNLPDMSGLELLSLIRQKEHLRHLPFLILTGAEDNESRNIAYRSGANAFLVKPFELEDLKSLIASLAAFWSRISFAC